MTSTAAALDPSRIGPADLALLQRAHAWDPEPARFAYMMRQLAGPDPIEHASRERFENVVDDLYGYGFRDPELPEVGPDFLAFLDARRRELGIGDDAFAEMLATYGGVDTLARLDGAGFIYVLDQVCRHHGGDTIRLPPRRFMDRGAIGYIHMAVHRLNLSWAEHVNVLVTVGGGCLRTSHLDRRGLRRVLAHYMAAGYEAPPPPPLVEGAPGFITQPQANLIWKLAQDLSIPSDGEALSEWMKTVAGIEGGLPALTKAGAHYVIDLMSRPLIGLRLQAYALLAAQAAAGPETE